MGAASSIHEWLRRREARWLELLERLVSIDSHTSNPAGVAAVATTLIERLEPLGFEFESSPPSPLGEDQRWLEELLSPGVPYAQLGSTYVGSAAGTGPGRLLLLGDLDTAFPDAGMEATVFRVEGGRAYGPGIADMKGGLVVLAAALEALHDLDLQRPETTVVLAGDEQAGSLGSRPIIERVGGDSDWCLCVECARRGGKLMGSRGHIGVGAIEVEGVEAHTGSAREHGADALEALAALVLGFKALSDPAAGTLVTVTMARAGRRRSVVPARAVATVDIRTRSPAAWDLLIEQLGGVVADVERSTGTVVTLRTYNHRPGVVWNEGTDALLAVAREVGAELSIEVDAFESAAAGSTAFAHPSTFVLDGLGPLGGDIMTASEHIEVDSLVPRAALLAALIQRLTALRSGSDRAKPAG